MFVMTYSQARQNLASFLDSALKDGQAFITRADGTKFKVTPVKEKKEDSPFSALEKCAAKYSSKIKNTSTKDLLKMLKEDEDSRTDKIILNCIK